jgi:hypothetical protein
MDVGVAETKLMLFAVGDPMLRASEPVAAVPTTLAFSVSRVVVAPHPLS